MDGIICNLKGVCNLADKYHALVMVDDSHAVGFVGKTGRGTPEYCGVQGRVDIITGTLGKLLEEHPAAIHLDEKRLLICCVREAVRICSLILLHRQLQEQA